MRQELREILTRVFVGIIIFLIGVVIYKQGNPYAYLGLEKRTLFVLVPWGIVLLYLYLVERENRTRLSSAIMVIIGRLRVGKFMRFEDIGQTIPLFARLPVSRLLAAVYAYFYRLYRYSLGDGPGKIVSYLFLGLLLVAAVDSFVPQMSLGWAKTPLMVVTVTPLIVTVVALGVGALYLNRGVLYAYPRRLRQHLFEDPGKIVSYLFLGLLLLVAVQSIAPESMPGWTMLESVKTPLMIATVALGMVTFYLNRGVLEDMEEEAQQEEIEEKRREMEFGEKYPRINRLWGVRWIVRWGHKEGLLIVILLIFFSVFGCFLIFHGIDNSEFNHDEWWHVSTIKSLQEGSGFKLWNYVTDEPICEYNSGKIFTWTTFQLSKIIGSDEFGLRFFTALVGTLIIPLIYIIFKKFIGKEVSLLVSVIFSFNIIAIYLARFLRPYTLFVFSYLIVFYFCYKFIRCVFKQDVLKSLTTMVWIVVFFVVALDSREFAKMLLMVVSLFYVGYVSYHAKNLYDIKNSKIVLGIGCIFICCIFTLNYFSIINLSILPMQIKDYISVSKIENPTTKYYEYLFEYPIKIPFLGYALFCLGFALLLINSLIKRKSKYSYFLLNTLIPLLMMIYLFDRYEDFRYIYFLIPFVYGCMMFGFYWLFQCILSPILKNNRSFKMFFMLIILLTLIIYPIVPGINVNGITAKGPSDWQGSDGQRYLHRRAVAPELDKAYNYVETNISSPYALVITDYRVKYLERFKSKTVYYLDPLRGEDKFYDMSTINGQVNLDMVNGTTASLQEILDRNEKVVFVCYNVHMFNSEIFDFLYTNTDNVAMEANISMYMYNSFYQGKELYWPNIFIYEK